MERKKKIKSTKKEIKPLTIKVANPLTPEKEKLMAENLSKFIATLY